MTEIKELVERLRYHAKGDSLSEISKKHPFAATLIEGYFIEAASALEALISRSAVMEEALRPFAAATLLNQSAVIVAGDGITQAFDSGKKHVTCLMEEDAGPAFNRARSALSLKAGKE